MKDSQCRPHELGRMEYCLWLYELGCAISFMATVLKWTMSCLFASAFVSIL